MLSCHSNGYRRAVKPARASRSPFDLSGRLSLRQVDWLVLAAAWLLSLPQLLFGPPGRTGLVVDLAFFLSATVPLLWRRSRPGTVLVVIVATSVGSMFLGRLGASGSGALFAVYAAAMYGDRWVRVGAGSVATLALVAAFGAVAFTSGPGRVGPLVGPAFGFGVAWVLGDRSRTQQAYLDELEERAARLQRERESDALRAAEDERVRIARELHDVVAHNVSMIAVQAGASRFDPAVLPEESDTMGLIERTARATLAELRAVLGALRREDPSPPSRAPRPTMARLNDLVAEAREAGISIDIQVAGGVRELPAVVDLSAYRIVQEALTNVLKHAPGAHVGLRVHYSDRGVEIVVEDDGPGSPSAASDGHGLIGMRERVALVGGDLHLGRGSANGFRIHAHLPLETETQGLGSPDPHRDARRAPQ